MDRILEFLPAAVAAYGVALLAWPILRMPNRFSAACGNCLGVAVLFCVLLIPSEQVVSRALLSLLCIELTFKVLDFSRRTRSRDRDGTRLLDYLAFLPPFPPMLVVWSLRERRLPRDRARWPDVLLLLFGVGLLAAGIGLVDLTGKVPALRLSYPLDHLIKVALFVVTIEGLSKAFQGLERLAGFDTKPLVQSCFLSLTVAEFWCRYNTRVHAWLDRNVFQAIGGRRSPVRAILLAFFVSAVFHELMFGLATSRFDGYQFTFFMLQAPMVMASRALHRVATRGGLSGKVLVRLITIAFMVVTSVFFFHGVDRIFPFFYASEPWLP